MPSSNFTNPASASYQSMKFLQAWIDLKFNLVRTEAAHCSAQKCGEKFHNLMPFYAMTGDETEIEEKKNVFDVEKTKLIPSVHPRARAWQPYLFVHSFVFKPVRKTCVWFIIIKLFCTASSTSPMWRCCLSTAPQSTFVGNYTHTTISDRCGTMAHSTSLRNVLNLSARDNGFTRTK